ncbi:MAG: nucleotide exchange factor GrpE [Candidatus Methanofastidiosia archaeon]|jgi:molecular chaperone GrpE
MDAKKIEISESDSEEVVSKEPISETTETLLRKIDELQKEIETREELVDGHLNMLQRLQAEFENYKKRAERERIEYTEQANADLILKLLSVLDDFERALQVKKSDTSDTDSFKKGMVMIHKKFQKILEKEGVTPIDAVGEEFDPYYHEAVLAEVGDYKDDTIIEELEKGYMFKNRVLRPSKVKVGKRGD